MLFRVREGFFRNTLLPENTSDTHENSLSLKSFVIFVSFKVNCVARECALGHVVRNPG